MGPERAGTRVGESNVSTFYKGRKGRAKATRQRSRKRVKDGVGRDFRDVHIYEKEKMSDIVPASANDSGTKGWGRREKDVESDGQYGLPCVNDAASHTRDELRNLKLKAPRRGGTAQRRGCRTARSETVLEPEQNLTCFHPQWQQRQRSQWSRWEPHLQLCSWQER